MENLKLTDDEALYYNWNRLSLLTRKKNLSELEKIEKTLRINLQNSQNIKLMRDTITFMVIKSVNKFMKIKHGNN